MAESLVSGPISVDMARPVLYQVHRSTGRQEIKTCELLYTGYVPSNSSDAADLTASWRTQNVSPGCSPVRVVIYRARHTVSKFRDTGRKALIRSRTNSPSHECLLEQGFAETQHASTHATALPEAVVCTTSVRATYAGGHYHMPSRAQGEEFMIPKDA